MSLRRSTGNYCKEDAPAGLLAGTFSIRHARAVVRVATNNNDGYMNQWVNQLKERRGFNKTTVAVANKNARIIWSMLRNETEYQAVGS